ncbi:MAG TPA: HAMP domain-containing sensor histidine kinase [Puia sp.]|nr:HAMP domain-containing sensor histidine kinase [Puia sp.]
MFFSRKTRNTPAAGHNRANGNAAGNNGMPGNAPGNDHAAAHGPATANGRPQEHDNALFIQDLIHDIQGDFLGVSGLCQSMKRGLHEKKDITPLVQMLVENCQTYKYKLSNFLEFTRLQAGLKRTMRERVNIRGLLNRVIDEYESLWIEKDAHVSLEVPRDFPEMISCDEGKVQLIIANLFVNAVNWAPGSKITISAGLLPLPDAGRDLSPVAALQTGLLPPGEGDEGLSQLADPGAVLPMTAIGSGAAPGTEGGRYWFVSVRDSGEGMTERQLEAVLREAPADRAVLRNRAGLGLKVSRRVAEEVLGGRLSLHSGPGIGVDARLEIPFYPYE